MEFRDAVKFMRSELGLTQLALATALHISPTTVIRWEKGQNAPVRSITPTLLAFARSKAASKECLALLEGAIQSVTKERLDFSGDGLYAVEHASLRQLIDEASFPIYVCDIETDELLYLNRKAAEMIGGARQALGRKCYDCLMHLDAPCPFCHKEELTDTCFKEYEAIRAMDGRTFQVQAKLIQWNGHRAQVRYVLTPGDAPKYGAANGKADAQDFEPAAGALSRTAGEESLKAALERANDGVLAFKQSEQETALLGERLNAIVNNVESGVTAVAVGKDGAAEYLVVNDRYYEMLGFTKAQYQKEVASPFDVIYGEDRERVRREVASLNELGKTATLRYRAVRRDGRVLWLNVRISIMSLADTDKPVQLSVLTDITGIVETQRQFKERRDQLNEILNTAPSGIAVVELDRRNISGTLRTTYYNDRFYSFSGYTREEYGAMLKTNEMSFVFEEDVPALLKDIQSICGGEIGNVVNSTIRCHTKGGGYRWLLLSGQLTKRQGDACVVKISMVDVTAHKEAEDRLRISEEMLRIAAETDKRVLVIYDVKANTCRAESRGLYSASYGEVIKNVPQALCQRGLVSADSAAECGRLFERIRSGEKSASCSMLLKTGENEYQWFECNATAVYDADGRPDHAVLVFHNITEQRVKEAVYKKWQQSIQARQPSTYTLFRCNLSKNSGLDEQEGELLKVKYPSDAASFNSRTKLYADEYVYQNDREAYVALLDSDALLAMYYRGERAAKLEYREIAEGQEPVWRRLTIELVEYLNSSDVQAFLMYEDIDDEKKAEIAARELAQTDPLTGALNRAAFAEKVEAALQETPSVQSALIMLDMDGFKQLNDTFGHAAGDQALQEVVAVARSYIQGDSLVCRLGGDEFLVWLHDIPYDAVIAKTAQQMCEHIRKAYSQEVLLSASAGIAVYPRDGLDYDELYRNADKALYKVKQDKKGAYAFFSVIGEEQTPEIAEAVSAVRQASQSSRGAKRRILIVDDNESGRAVLKGMFKDEYLIETAKNGAEAMIRLRHFGSSISVVLLDLFMPGMDGFAVLTKMQNNAELRTIPVIVVSGDEDHKTLLKAIGLGASEYVTKPVDADLIRMRVQSAISKAENERLRAQNSYLKLQRDEEAKYRTVLDSTGTVVVEYDWRNHVFTYDSEISKYIAGTYDHRGIWQVFLADMVADSADVKILQDLLISLANDRGRTQDGRLVKLKTPEHKKHWFRMSIYKTEDEYGLAEKMIITFNDVHEEVLANEKLLYQATRDELTGLYNRAGFIEKAAELIKAKEPGYYVMACIDIERFKVINDQYGTHKGDEVLRKFAKVLKELHHSDHGICCRVSADSFAALYPASLLDSPELRRAHSAVEHLDDSIPSIRFAAGRCLVDDKSLDVSAIYDRAAIAKTTIKGRYDVHIAMYDETMRTAILRQQEITGQMNHALENGQFEVWLQPQFNHATGMLSGAEALVRWRHPKEGIISPTEFIPIFERNGFVYEVDKYVWEKTCVLLRKWLDQGLSPVPVSVNISRYDVFRDDLISVIKGLVKKFDLPIELLRLEITESAFSESSEQIIKVVQTLVDAGFIVEIDDFGSGYSSLNTLKDVPAQILKMDMRFLENDKNAQRGGSIIESVVRMAKWLGMSVIAEGVETIEQADYLKSIGCEYIQGYLYSKPKAVPQYEEMLAEGKIESRLDKLKSVETWNNNAFWNPTSMETLIFNSYVGGACIFEYMGEKAELLRYNASYARIFDRAPEFNDSNARQNILSVLDEANAKAFRECIVTAIDTKREAACELEIANRENTATMFLRATLRQIAQAGEQRLFYCVVTDMTEQRVAEREKSKSSARLRVIMDNMDGGVAASVVRDGKICYLFANDRYYELLGYKREEYTAQFTGHFNAIHPDDRERTDDVIRQAVRDGKPYNVNFRIIRHDGAVRWVSCHINIISLPDTNEPVHIAALSDITELHEAQRKENENADKLRTILNSAQNGMAAAVLHESGPKFMLINDKYFEIHGITRSAYERGELTDPIGLSYPDDQEAVRRVFGQTADIGEQAEIEYRIIRPDGDIRWIKAVIRVVKIVGIDEPVQVTVFADTTEQKNIVAQLRFLNKSAHDILMQTNIEQAITETLQTLLRYHQADRGYVVELNYEKMLSYNTYEVCADGVIGEKDARQALPFAPEDDWYDSLINDHFFYIGDTAALGEDQADVRALLLAQGVHAMILAPLYCNATLIGFAGLDNPRLHLRESERLSAMGDYISILVNRREAARGREERQKSLLDNLPCGAALYEFDGKRLTTIHLNKRYEEMTGRRLNSATTERPPIEYIHPDDRMNVIDEIRNAIAQGRNGACDVRVLYGDAEYRAFHVDATIAPKGGGRFTLYATYSQLSDQAFSFREALPVMFSTMMESTAELAFAKGRDFRYLCCSRSFAALVGLSDPKKVVGRDDYELFPADTAAQFRKDDDDLMTAGEPQIDKVEDIPSSDGALHRIRTSKYLLRNTAGEMIGIYCTGRDLTDDKEA